MFENDSDLKKIVSRLDIDTHPNPDHRDSLRRKMLSVFQQTQKTSSHAPSWQIIGRTIMKSKITKLAVAAVVMITVLLSVVLLDKSIPSAYALEQTMKAYDGLSFVHIKHFKLGESEPQEFWVKYDDKEVKQVRIDSPKWAEPQEGPLKMVWKDGKMEVLGKDEDGNQAIVVRQRMDLGAEILELVKNVDPRSKVEELYLYQLETEGKAEITTSEPKVKSEPIIITAKILSPISDAGNELILYVDQSTKLVTRVVFNKTKELDENQHSWEFSDYNISVDPNFFTLKAAGENVPRYDLRKLGDNKIATATFMENINAKLASLDINTSSADDVIAVLGEPWAYRFRGEGLREDNLPEVYTMDYPGGFMVSIYKNQVMLWGCQQISGYEISGYVFPDSIQIGTTLDDVFEKLGSPTKIVEGFGGEDNKIMYEDNTSYVNMNINERKGFCFSRYDNNGEEIKLYLDDNVLYKDLRKIKGLCLYGTVSKGKRIRFSFMDNKVVAIYEYRTEPLGGNRIKPENKK